jgi:hypothetical protein
LVALSVTQCCVVSDLFCVPHRAVVVVAEVRTIVAVEADRVDA